MTLIELIIALIIMSGVILFISFSVVFFMDQVQSNIERSNIYTQLSYTMEDMKMRCVSAIDIGSSFSAGGEEKPELIFKGETDIYNVNPDNPDVNSKSWYKYYLNNGDMVIKTCGPMDSTCSTGSEEVLIDKIYNPTVSFAYNSGESPSLLRVKLTAQSNKVPLGADKEITKEGAIRFWFIDIAK